MTFQSNNMMQSSFPQSAQSMFQPGFAGTNSQEVRYQNQTGFSQASAAPTYGAFSYGGNTGNASAQSMFQPGFAGTNAQEVQYQNQTGFSQASAAPAFGGFSSGGIAGNASAQSMFQPGFAGTNAQEVRQLNQSFSQQPFGGFTQSQASYQPSFGAQSIFSPGFAGTNVNEVQARNSSYNALSNNLGSFPQASMSSQGQLFGGGANSVFSPGFAGTNTQEVRQQNQNSAAFANTSFQQQPQAQLQQQAFYGGYPQQTQATAGQLGFGAQAVFSPNFAGTNVQEVRALNAGQAAPHTGSIFPGSF
ncbi:hypothetical protein [Brevibacillus panacihumi]|uniref:Uncharacterized protein n=1 Tax=Brevibacillus panacihumi TaxID=497735 RepID=A0A3M8C147_9BACL|nr:hypothetical protein [Brevibacillus panacihumi]RNB68635.1 hypothetical protein EDM58_24560 [Brevibacillus panacihumi]